MQARRSERVHSDRSSRELIFSREKRLVASRLIGQVAVKVLEKEKINDQKDVERITREIKILKKVRHPNVIQLYEVSSHFDNHDRLSRQTKSCT